MPKTSGRLVLCPTPLGNLEDITLRTLRELRECDVIFAEDTRVTRKLLSYFDIAKPLESFHESAHARRVRRLRAALAAGKSVAVVTDAGMPGISDPGAELVRAAREAGAAIDALPGPNAALGALVLSGFDISRFRFDGFPPRKSGERKAYLQGLADEPQPAVLYEAPSRVTDLLDDIAALLPGCDLFVASVSATICMARVIFWVALVAAMRTRISLRLGMVGFQMSDVTGQATDKRRGVLISDIQHCISDIRHLIFVMRRSSHIGPPLP